MSGTWHDLPVTTDANEQEPATRLIDRVAEAARKLKDAEAQHRTTASEFAEALLAAHEGGFTWTEVARAADLGSAETARVRAQRARDTKDLTPAIRWRMERGSTPRPGTTAPGLSVTEAARSLDVSRKTVYAWMRSGKLRSTSDESGRTRVLLDDD